MGTPLRGVFLLYLVFSTVSEVCKNNENTQVTRQIEINRLLKEKIITNCQLNWSIKWVVDFNLVCRLSSFLLFLARHHILFSLRILHFNRKVSAVEGRVKYSSVSVQVGQKQFQSLFILFLLFNYAEFLKIAQFNQIKFKQIIVLISTRVRNPMSQDTD